MFNEIVSNKAGTLNYIPGVISDVEGQRNFYLLPRAMRKHIDERKLEVLIRQKRRTSKRLAKTNGGGSVECS